MDIKVRGKYEEKPLKLKDIRPMLKNLRIRSKSSREEEQDEKCQNPQNYAEYKISTSSKKVAEKSILAVGFSVKRLKFKGKQAVKADAPETGGSAASDSIASTILLKKQKEKRRAQTAASIRQHAMQQSVVQTHRLQRRRNRNYQIKRIKNQIRNQTIVSSSVVLLAMVLFVFTLSMFFFLAEDGEGNIEAGQPALMVSVAKSQIGNAGGKKYWRWYGFDEPVDWCACFVSWCASEAGLIEENLAPRFSRCGEGIQWFMTEGRWIDAIDVPGIKPTPGMIVFFDWEQDGIADHVGIVETCRNGRVYTVEGNRGDKVVNWYYLQDCSNILGYGFKNVS